MGRAHRRSNLKFNSTKTNTNLQINKTSFLSNIANIASGYIIGNSISRMIFINKDNLCYEKFKKYTECIDTSDIRDRRYNNEDCKFLLEEFNKCYNNK